MYEVFVRVTDRLCFMVNYQDICDSQFDDIGRR